MNEHNIYNRKILYTIILFLLIIAGIGLRFYFVQQKENSALRVKILSLSKVKKTPIPWSYLTQERKEKIEKNKSEINKNGANEETAATSSNVNSSLTSPATSNTKLLPPTPKRAITERPISDQSTEELAGTLTNNMVNIKSLNLPFIEKNIQIANEIISREPNSYLAYKAKLISMLVKEGKFNQAIDDYELNQVLDNMAIFEIASNTIARREAVLISTTNNQLAELENKLEDIRILRDEISTQSAALDKSSTDYQEFQAANEQLAKEEQNASEEIEAFQDNMDNEDLSSIYLNEDIVEIPFLRLMAKNDYESVISNAESFIEQFPNSLIGHYYLVKALELEARNDDAIRVLEESKLSPDAKNILLGRLEATSKEDPRQYWEKLNF